MAQEGEIWPNIPIQLTIVFSPKEARFYQETIYCDVTGEFGPLLFCCLAVLLSPLCVLLSFRPDLPSDPVGRESGLALTLMGEALGPNLQPDYNVMDMGEIFMGSSNYYQVRNRQPEWLFLSVTPNTGRTAPPYASGAADKQRTHRRPLQAVQASQPVWRLFLCES